MDAVFSMAAALAVRQKHRDTIAVGRALVSKTRMLEHVKNYRWKEIRDDLEEDPKLKKFRDEKGRNWLHLTCMVNPGKRKLKPADSIKVARVLLDAGFGVSDVAFTEGRWKATPVWHAAGRGRNIALVKFLLEQGADPNYALWATAWHDDLPMIRLLVKHGAIVDDRSVPDGTPFIGTVCNHFASAEQLLKLGADVDAVDKKGRTALHLFLERDVEKPQFWALLKYNPRGDIKDAKGRTAIEILSRKRDPDFRKMAEQLTSA